MHLDDERIQRTLHGELSLADRDATVSHLASCEPCRRALETAAREEERIFTLLRAIDHEPPAVDPRSLVRRAPAPSTRWHRWAAAAIVLLTLAGAAYAIPGSPVRAWLDRVIGRTPPSTVKLAPESAIPSEDVVSGLSVAPTMRFSIRFADLTISHQAIVTIGGTPEVQIRAIGDEASFTTGIDVLTVRPGPRASFEVDLPQEAPWIEILVGDRPLLLKDGDHVVTTAPIDAAGRYHLELPASSR